jgi:hypothetical protein
VSDWSDDSEALFDADREGSGPSREARARVRGRVMARVARNAGAAAAATAATAAARGAGAASGGATAGLAKGALIAIGWKIALPLALFGAVGVASATGMVSLRHAPPSSPSSRAETTVTPSAPNRTSSPVAPLAQAAPSASPVSSARATVPAPGPAPAPPAPVSVSVATPRPAPALPKSSQRAPASPLPPTDTLASELARVNTIEDALRGGDPARAAALADDYTRSYPSGAFREEASGERVIALCTASRSRTSTDAAIAFARVHPASLLLPRIRAACGAAYDSVTDDSATGQ